MERADYWIDLMKSMHLSWCLAKSDSDAFYTSGAAKALLDAGITPIVRFSYTFPAPFTEMDAVSQLVNLYGQYGKKPIIQFANEPFDDREWKNGEVPPYWEAWGIIRDRWLSAQKIITERGGIAGFPDGPTYADNPFLIIGDEDLHWQEGRSIFITHNYGKGRPVNYPEDDVSWSGTPITYDEYVSELDVYGDDPQWNEGPAVVEMMNEQRAEWANPGLTALDDDTCWHGWQKTLQQSREAFGFEVRIGMGEGGWVPRDRAGSNPIDIRWPYTTPQKVGEKTLAIFQENSPLEFICPWLLANSLMGSSGSEFDAWVTGDYRPEYWLELPVVQMLQENPPDATKQAAVRIAAAQVRLDRAVEALR